MRTLIILSFLNVVMLERPSTVLLKSPTVNNNIFHCSSTHEVTPSNQKFSEAHELWLMTTIWGSDGNNPLLLSVRARSVQNARNISTHFLTIVLSKTYMPFNLVVPFRNTTTTSHVNVHVHVFAPLFLFLATALCSDTCGCPFAVETT